MENRPKKDPTSLPTPPATTLDAIAEEHMAKKTELMVAGQPGPVLVQPWHVAAIKAKHKIPGNRELTTERFHQLLEDVVNVTIGGPPESPKQ